MIVMSKYFWNEFKKALLNKEILNDVLKFHQRTISQLNDSDKTIEMQDEIIRILECDKINLPSINTRYFDFNNLVDGDFKHIIKVISNFYKVLETTITLPMLYLNKAVDGIEYGCYTIDLNEHKLVGYSYLGNYIKTLCDYNSIDLALFIFINIEDAICLYKEWGYIKSIEQIGGLTYQLQTECREKNIQILHYSLNAQKATHDIGINLRKEILIESLFFTNCHHRKD